jgi:hypothetical protein
MCFSTGLRNGLLVIPARCRAEQTGRSGAYELSSFFIKRPVATTLMVVAIIIAGAMAFNALPVASLPQVDFATITVASQHCPAQVPR